MFARVERFQRGVFYPIIVAILVMVFRIFALDVYCFGFLSGVMVFTLFFNKNVIATLPPLLMGVFAVTPENVPFLAKDTVAYSDPKIILSFLVMGVLIFAALVFRLIRNKATFRLSSLGVATLIFCVSMVSGGLGYKEYKIESCLMSLLLAVAYLGVYYLYSAGVRYKEGTFVFVAKVMVVIGFLLLAQLLYVYFFYKPFDNNPGKMQLNFGWGNSNNMGSYLLVCLPFSLGLLFKEKHVIFFTVSSFVLYISLFFTMSRTCIILASILFFIFLIVLIVKLKDVTRLKFLATCIALLMIVGITAIILRNHLQFLLDYFVKSGLDDNYRTELIIQGFKKFKERPIFGFGIMNGSETEFYTKFYHNTIVQIMVSFGGVGLAAYAFYIIYTIIMCIKNFNSENQFYIIAVLLVILNGLFDIATFAHNIIFVYAVCLALIEKNKNFKGEKAKKFNDKRLKLNDL